MLILWLRSLYCSENSPKEISQTDKPKLDHNEHSVTCINCNFSV